MERRDRSRRGYRGSQGVEDPSFWKKGGQVYLLTPLSRDKLKILLFYCKCFRADTLAFRNSLINHDGLTFINSIDFKF